MTGVPAAGDIFATGGVNVFMPPGRAGLEAGVIYEGAGNPTVTLD